MANQSAPIDRQRVVQRHIVKQNTFDIRSPLTVGNGNIAFGVDATGLQTFTDPYLQGMPVCTMADWGWHSKPMPAGLDPKAIRYTNFDTYGRPVGHITSADGQKELFDYLRENPHKFHLGKISVEVTKSDGSIFTQEDVQNIDQQLDPWTGIIITKFAVEDQPIEVTTCCAEQDVIGVQVKSKLIAASRLKVIIRFPYGSQDMSTAEWGKDSLHSSTLEKHLITRKMDDINYFVAINGSVSVDARGAHEFAVSATDQIAFTASFSIARPSQTISFEECAISSKKFWESFWKSGGAVDLEGSTDPRAHDLERRIVLSQYLLRINSSSLLPPAETGLTCNSWYGKFHLEMHWWHGVHHALWGRLDLLEKSLGYYDDIHHVAKDIAARQGYTGVRWPKMVGPSGVDAPSPVGPLLIWQQPHPIYYAELVYREKPTVETLKRFQKIVFDTAEFMASFAHHDATADRYVLGPPLKTVSENTDPRTSRNATYELTYWRFGLRLALLWQKRLGLPENANWKRVLEKLSCASIQDDKYLMQEDMTDTYTKWNWEHPALTGAYGMLPGDEIDPAVMKRTVEQVMSNWQWDRCWGWDFPMVAMCAARTGRPDLAIDAFFAKSIKNDIVNSGHNYQRPSLPLYLPGNGAFLTAIAMMCAGWETGAQPDRNAPGFPENGWKVRHEGLRKIF